jgi:hypothetical protein
MFSINTRLIKKIEEIAFGLRIEPFDIDDIID